jgi:hypothetical protein
MLLSRCLQRAFTVIKIDLKLEYDGVDRTSMAPNRCSVGLL